MKTEQLESIVAEYSAFIRQKHGSHRIYEGLNGKHFAFAFHRGKTVAPHLVRKVLVSDVGLSVEEAENAAGVR